MVAMPHVRGAHAAGKLTVGLWDHWVPTANAASTALIEEWAAKEKVEVQIDYITTQGNKLLLTEQAEAQSRTGHDIFTFRCWGPADHAKLLEPLDDVMGPLIKQNGAANATAAVSRQVRRALGGACRRRGVAMSRDHARASTS